MCAWCVPLLRIALHVYYSPRGPKESAVWCAAVAVTYWYPAALLTRMRPSENSTSRLMATLLECYSTFSLLFIFFFFSFIFILAGITRTFCSSFWISQRVMVCRLCCEEINAFPLWTFLYSITKMVWTKKKRKKKKIWPDLFERDTWGTAAKTSGLYREAEFKNIQTYENRTFVLSTSLAGERAKPETQSLILLRKWQSAGVLTLNCFVTPHWRNRKWNWNIFSIDWQNQSWLLAIFFIPTRHLFFYLSAAEKKFVVTAMWKHRSLSKSSSRRWGGTVST